MQVGEMVWALRRDGDGVPRLVEAVAVTELDVATGESPTWLHTTRDAAVAEARLGVESALTEAEGRVAELRDRLSGLGVA